MRKLIIVVILLFTLVGCKPSDATIRLDTPQNLIHEDSTISFDAVEYATSYVLEVNDEEIILTTTSYTFQTSGAYSIRVKARAEGYLDSFYTDQYSFTIFVNVSDVRFNYSIQSSFDLLAYTFEEDVVITSIQLNETNLSSSNYMYTNQQLMIPSSYLTALDPDLYTFEVNLGLGESFDLVINVMDTNLPYIVSYNTLTYNEGEDINIWYELFGGTIQGLSSGYAIDASDYSIDDNILTIKSSYVSEYFNEFTTQQTLSIRYTLSKNDEYVLGYIFINKNN